MCIIVFKPEGVPFPEKKILKTCFENNPDGAGFMYRKDSKVYIQKGYMTPESLFRALKLAGKKIGGFEDVDLVIHFRIATHGTVEPGQTHPFPITDDYSQLVKTRTVVNQALAHNGILLEYAPLGWERYIFSDTMRFIINNASNIQDALKKHNRHGGRFVLMNSKETKIFGNFIKNGGLYYSNDTYIKKPEPLNLWLGGKFGFKNPEFLGNLTYKPKKHCNCVEIEENQLDLSIFDYFM